MLISRKYQSSRVTQRNWNLHIYHDSIFPYQFSKLDIEHINIEELVYSNGTISKINPNIKKIYNYAFYNCTNLKNVQFPESLQYFELNAFEGCIKLELIIFNSQWVDFDSQWLNEEYNLYTKYNFKFSYYSKNDTIINVAPGVKKIGINAFKKHPIERFISKNDLEKVSENCLASCKTLIYADISSVRIIGSGAFSGCSSLASITLSDKLTSIGASAFSGCPLLKINLPHSMTIIEISSFSSCGLETIEIPNGYEIIEEGAFAFCAKLKYIQIPDSVYQIGMNVFLGCSSLVSVSLPSGITNISFRTFSFSGLTSIEIPFAITHIYYEAFSMSKLEQITIPRNVEYISVSAFLSCLNLKNVVIQGSPKILGYAFSKSVIETILFLKECQVSCFAFFECINIQRIIFKGFNVFISTEYINDYDFAWIDDSSYETNRKDNNHNNFEKLNFHFSNASILYLGKNLDDYNYDILGYRLFQSIGISVITRTEYRLNTFCHLPVEKKLEFSLTYGGTGTFLSDFLVPLFYHFINYYFD